MVNRVCRDCPVPGCGAKYLVKLSNHLTDVHLMDHIQRLNLLQKAKLQPKVKIITYQDTKTSKSFQSTSEKRLAQQEEIIYQKSLPRKKSRIGKDIFSHRLNLISEKKNMRKEGSPTIGPYRAASGRIGPHRATSGLFGPYRSLIGPFRAISKGHFGPYICHHNPLEGHLVQVTVG